MQKDHFETKAKEWDKGSKRVKNVKAISEGIVKKIALYKNMQVMDFGSGTGLLTAEIAPYVLKITCVDTSSSMNEQIKQKEFPCELEIIAQDITQSPLDKKFDCIISSMTLHHVEDVEKLFEDFYRMLKNGGAIALADLDAEDGKFHSDNEGVHHFGFKESFIVSAAQKAGFEDIHFEIVSTIEKPHNSYDVFLLTAKK